MSLSNWSHYTLASSFYLFSPSLLTPSSRFVATKPNLGGRKEEEEEEEESNADKKRITPPNTPPHLTGPKPRKGRSIHSRIIC